MTRQEYKKILRDVENQYKSNLINDTNRKEFLTNYFLIRKYYYSDEYRKGITGVVDFF